MTQPEPVEVFYSYSHKDEALRNELADHLSLLKRQGVISEWHDRQLMAGDEWDGVIKEELNTADIILLLVSSSFMASDYCYGVEVDRAMERHKAKEACVIPVILRPVAWKKAPFGKLTAFPTDGKAVTLWDNQDSAFLDIEGGIEAAAKKLMAERRERLLNVGITGIEALQGYAKKYRENHGQIKLLRMPQAVDLETIYTRVRLLDQYNPYRSSEDLEEFFRGRDREQMREARELDGFDAVNENPRLMVLGAPGAGKSTFLRRVGLEALKAGIDANSLFKHRCIPVFLELKKFKTHPVDIVQAMTRELNRLGFAATEAAIVKALKEGQFLILFDGLDEVPKDNLNGVMEEIQEFVKQYDQNRFIASCRIAAYRSGSSFNRF
jgi:hypothetical protein